MSLSIIFPHLGSQFNKSFGVHSVSLVVPQFSLVCWWVQWAKKTQPEVMGKVAEEVQGLVRGRDQRRQTDENNRKGAAG